MGILKKHIYFLLVFVSMFSCSILETGYFNEDDEYVPKHPRYRYKDKEGNNIPENLDTINVYKLQHQYFLGMEVYPLDSYNQYQKQDNTIIIKFYSKGRFMSSGIPVVENTMLDLFLNPNGSNKGYYYSKDGKTIILEDFSYGEGWGRYNRLEYLLNKSGDTLIHRDEKMTYIYVREKLSVNRKKYKVYW